MTEAEQFDLMRKVEPRFARGGSTSMFDEDEKMFGAPKGVFSTPRGTFSGTDWSMYQSPFTSPAAVKSRGNGLTNRGTVRLLNGVETDENGNALGMWRQPGMGTSDNASPLTAAPFNQMQSASPVQSSVTQSPTDPSSGLDALNQQIAQLPKAAVAPKPLSFQPEFFGASLGQGQPVQSKPMGFDNSFLKPTDNEVGRAMGGIAEPNSYGLTPGARMGMDYLVSGLPSPVAGGTASPQLDNVPQAYPDPNHWMRANYITGGGVDGGPPGVDTVHAALTNKEYVLPEATANAMGGKEALDQAVLSTTGHAPVGYDTGSQYQPEVGLWLGGGAGAAAEDEWLKRMSPDYPATNNAVAFPMQPAFAQGAQPFNPSGEQYYNSPAVKPFKPKGEQPYYNSSSTFASPRPMPMGVGDTNPTTQAFQIPASMGPKTEGASIHEQAGVAPTQYAGARLNLPVDNRADSAWGVPAPDLSPSRAPGWPRSVQEAPSYAQQIKAWMNKDRGPIPGMPNAEQTGNRVRDFFNPPPLGTPEAGDPTITANQIRDFFVPPPSMEAAPTAATPVTRGVFGDAAGSPSDYFSGGTTTPAAPAAFAAPTPVAPMPAAAARERFLKDGIYGNTVVGNENGVQVMRTYPNAIPQRILDAANGNLPQEILKAKLAEANLAVRGAQRQEEFDAGDIDNVRLARQRAIEQGGRDETTNIMAAINQRKQVAKTLMIEGLGAKPDDPAVIQAAEAFDKKHGRPATGEDFSELAQLLLGNLQSTGMFGGAYSTPIPGNYRYDPTPPTWGERLANPSYGKPPVRMVDQNNPDADPRYIPRELVPWNMSRYLGPFSGK